MPDRRLTTLFTGRDDWMTFPGTTTCHSIFNGSGNTKEVVFPAARQQRLQPALFDVERKERSIYWGKQPHRRALPPGRGYLVDGRGKFYGDDMREFCGDDMREFCGDDMREFCGDDMREFCGDHTHEGKPIKARFVWSGITRTMARWEQEFSYDGGATGESNWVMEFARV